MSYVDNIVSRPRHDMILSVVDKEKVNEIGRFDDLVAFVSNPSTYPCCDLSKLWILAPDGIIVCFGPNHYSWKSM